MGGRGQKGEMGTSIILSTIKINFLTKERNGNTAVGEHSQNDEVGLQGLAFCLGTEDQRHGWNY